MRSQLDSWRQSETSTPTAPAGKPGLSCPARSGQRVAVAHGDRNVVVRTARCELFAAVEWPRWQTMNPCRPTIVIPTTVTVGTRLEEHGGQRPVVAEGFVPSTTGAINPPGDGSTA